MKLYGQVVSARLDESTLKMLRSLCDRAKASPSQVLRDCVRSAFEQRGRLA
jgi:hypothetical protein